MVYTRAEMIMEDGFTKVMNRLKEIRDQMNQEKQDQLEQKHGYQALEVKIEDGFRRVMRRLEEIRDQMVEEEEEQSEVKGSDLQPQHQQDTVVSGSDETPEKDENPLQVQSEIEEEKNQVTGGAVEINQKNEDEWLDSKPRGHEGGKSNELSIIQGNSRRFRDLAVPSEGMMEEKNLCWYAKDLKKEIRAGLWLDDPGGFKDELEVQIGSNSYGSGHMGSKITYQVRIIQNPNALSTPNPIPLSILNTNYFSPKTLTSPSPWPLILIQAFANPNFSSTETLAVSSHTANPTHDLTNPNSQYVKNPNSPPSKTLIALPPLLNPPHDHPNPNIPSTITLISPSPHSLLCDFVTNGFHQRSDAKLQQMRSRGLYLWWIEHVGPGHKCGRPKLVVDVTKTKSVGEDNVAANFKCEEDTKNNFESDFASIELPFSSVFDSPTQLLGILHTATCLGPCSESVVQYFPHKRSCERIGKSTKVVFLVLAEKDGLLISVFMFSALNLLNKIEQNSYLNRENQFRKVSLLEYSRDHILRSVLCRRKQMDNMFPKSAPESIISRCSNILCNDEGSVFLWAPIIRAMLESQFHDFDEEDILRSIAFAVRGRPMEQQSFSFDDEKNMALIRLVGMLASPGDEVRKTILSCITAYIRVVFVTVDKKTTADSLCKKLGSFGMETFEGDSYTTFDVDELPSLQRIVESQHLTLFTRVFTSHKKILVEALQHQNEVVAMTGEGENGAVAKKVSDMILVVVDNVATIVTTIAKGTAIYDNTRQFLRHMISSNNGDVLCIFVAVVFGILDSTLVLIQLLLVSLATDGLHATDFGFHKRDADVMKGKPRKVKETIVFGCIRFRFLNTGVYVELVTAAEIGWWFLYQEAGMYLLNNPFSALEAHTATSILDAYKQEWLAGNMVLLAMHQVDLLAAIDSVLLMLEGESRRVVTYELLASSQEFEDLVNAGITLRTRCWFWEGVLIHPKLIRGNNGQVAVGTGNDLGVG